MDFNNIYVDFVHKLSRIDVMEESKLVECLSKNVVELAKHLKIGYIAVNKYDIYKEEGNYDATAVFDEIPYKNGEKCSTKVDIYPVKGVTWTDFDRKKIQLFSDSLYLVGSRTMLLSLLKKTSLTDAMTGIPNDSGAHVLANKLEEERRLAEFYCFFINVKNFKLINKRFTAYGGDMVMKAFATFLQNIVDGEEEFAARLGGDNFLLLIKNKHVDRVLQQLQLIPIRTEWKNKVIEWDIEAHVGYVNLCEEDSFSDAINKSSIALTYSRRRNVSILKYEKEMNTELLNEKKISSIFADAIKNQEFEAYFQPKVDAQTQKICGAEALVRWIREDKVIPPMEFIPILEREGSICQLDFYVLEKVCQAIRDWLDKGMEPVKVSVNFSRGHLHNKELSAEILDVIRFYNIPSRYIEVELTETADYEDFKTMEQFVQNIRSEGISVSIDDFGTGYSSITMLRDLDIDTVKMDRSFVINLQNGDAKDRVMIESVTNMVKSLGREVLVEGVESKEQYEYLRDVGCDVIQGFYFNRPMPLNDFNEILCNRDVYSA